jgi:hypothetical protein
MSAIKFLVVLACVTLATACASQHGNYAAQDASRYAKIRVDYTEPKQLYETMGQPIGVVYNGGRTGWVYVETDYSVHGASFIPIVGIFTSGSVLDIRVTTFWFEDNVLLDTSFESYNEYVNAWEELAMMPRSFASSPEGEMIEHVKTEMEKRNLPYSDARLEDDTRAVQFLWMARHSI